MSLIQRYALAALTFAAFVLSACGGEPPSPANCWIYDFTSAPVSSNGSPINLISGVWVNGSGIITAESEITANWTEPFNVSMTAVHVAVARPLGVTGNIDATIVASIFGRDINQSNTLPDGTLEGTVSITFPSAPASGSVVNGVVQVGDGKSLVVTSITIELPAGEPSPFPSNPCGPTPTDTPAPTDTPVPTDTPTETPTGPTHTPTPGCFSQNYTGATTGIYAPYWDSGFYIGTGTAPKFRFPWNDLNRSSEFVITFALPTPGDITGVTVTWGRSWTSSTASMLVTVVGQPGNVPLMSRTGSQSNGQTYTIPQPQGITLSPTVYIESVQFVYSNFDTGPGGFGPNSLALVGCPPGPTPTPTPLTPTPATSCSGTYTATSPHWTGGNVEALTGGTVRHDDDGTATLTLPTSAGGGSVNVVWRRELSLGTSGNVEVYAQPSNTLLMELSETLAASTIPDLEPLIMGALLPNEETESIEFVFDDLTGIYGPQALIVNCLPPPTPLPTVGTPTATPTGLGVSTSTPQPTYTPLNTPTRTPTSTPTAPPPPTPPPGPTDPPPPSSTRVPQPTFKFTSTRWPTYPGPALTPIPGGTMVLGTTVLTPRAGTLASTPFRQATALPVPGDLREHHPGIREYLETAVGYVNELPNDLGGIAPSIEGAFPIFAGYAKWAMSSVSLQEIFGPRLYVIPVHMFYGVVIIITVSIITMIFKIALFFVKLALWVIRFILKIIPFIG